MDMVIRDDPSEDVALKLRQAREQAFQTPSKKDWCIPDTKRRPVCLEHRREGGGLVKQVW